jgi:putative hemolysin
MKKTLVIWLAVFVGLVIIGSALSLSGVFKSKNTKPAIGTQNSTQTQNVEKNASPATPATESNNQEVPATTEVSKNQSGTTTAATTGIANPASTNCLKIGGRLVTKVRGDGGQYSICYVNESRGCEEWALMRGDCPAEGVSVTELNTIDQKYCAWSGGQTKAEANSTCVLKNGSKCSTLDFFNGVCPK